MQEERTNEEPHSQVDRLFKLLIQVQSKFPESDWRFNFTVGQGAFAVSNITGEQLKAIAKEFIEAKLDGVLMHCFHNAGPNASSRMGHGSIVQTTEKDKN